MKSPVFSIIVTTYNRKELLPKAIGSALNQTFPNFEILVIDNGSTDGTDVVVKGIGDTRINYVNNPNPTPSCEAPRNLGIQMAKGSLISFLDDDDLWYPDKLKKVKQAFDENPDAYAVCHNLNKRIDGKISGLIKCGPWTDKLYEVLLYERCCITPTALTIKADLLRKLDGFKVREEFIGAGDYDLYLRMSSKKVKIYFMEETLGEFSVTGINYSITNSEFASKVALLIKKYILEYEKRLLFRISRRGLSRLFQLYYIAGCSFLRAHSYKLAFKHCFQMALFILIKPIIILDLYKIARRKMS